jgi:hypothetical protein
MRPFLSRELQFRQCIAVIAYGSQRRLFAFAGAAELYSIVGVGFIATGPSWPWPEVTDTAIVKPFIQLRAQLHPCHSIPSEARGTCP